MKGTECGPQAHMNLGPRHGAAAQVGQGPSDRGATGVGRKRCMEAEGHRGQAQEPWTGVTLGWEVCYFSWNFCAEHRETHGVGLSVETCVTQY